MKKSVAIIGASRDRSKFGNKAVRAFRDRGYEVFPIHPRETHIEGLAVWKSVLDLPEPPSIVTVYVLPSVLAGLLPDIAARGCDSVWLNPGTSSPEILAEAGRLGLKVIEGCSILAIGASPGAY